MSAQPSLHYIEKLNTAQGLSSNRTSDIIQDSQGFLWIGTAHGLNRYDGTEVVQYFAGNGKNNITDNIIFQIVGLDTNHIAIATHHGLSILDTRVDTFQHIFFPTDSIWEPYDNMINLLEKDKTGNLWAGTTTSLYRLDSDLKIQKAFTANYKVADLRKKRFRFVYKILPLESGNVLAWLENDIYIWQPPARAGDSDTLISIRQWNKGKLSFLENSPSNHCFQVYKHYLVYLKVNTDSLYVYDELTGRKSSCFFPDYNPEHINWHQRFSELEAGWLAFSFELKGMALVKIEDRDQQLSIRYEPKVYFPDYTFRKLMQDNEGNRWITTDVDGLLKISPKKQLFQGRDLLDAHTGKKSSYEVISFFPFKKSLFIASYGGGLFEWHTGSDPEKLENHSIRTHHFTENMVWNIRHERGDTLWLGTQHGLIWYHANSHQHGYLKQPHPKILDSFTITTQFVDSKGLVWMGLGAGHGVCVYDPGTKKFHVFPNAPDAYPFRYPIAVAEDQESNLWFLSDNVSDLVRWSRVDGQFKIVLVSQFEKKGYKFTGGFYLDKRGDIWYGLESAGLICYNIKSHKAKTYGTDDGLNTDLIFSIREDTSGRLWIATAQGLSCFDTVLHRFVNYGSNEGLPGTYCSANLFYDTQQHKMYAGAPGKIISFSPGLFNPTRRSMKVQLTRLLVDDKSIPVPKSRHIRLAWSNNDITLFFTGINLNDGSKNRYAYQLGKGPWVNIDQQRQIHFASLSPGNYNFIIKGSRKGDSWSPLTDHLELTIRPPFTRTVWFYLILVAFISGLIYAWYRYRYMHLLKLEKMRSRISHDLHDEIGSHLTNISLMSLIAGRQLHKEENLKHFLERIYEDSQKVSQSMREIVWNVDPENDELNRALPRMLRYATEMLEAKDINVIADIPDLHKLKMDMKKRHALFLIFKETINNIVIHSKAENVTISLKLQNGLLLMQITDDGKGFEVGHLPYRNGLQYMEERAVLHHWDLAVYSALAKGTTVTLRMKL